MKRKLFTLLVASIMATGTLIGCGGGDSADTSSKDTSKAEEETAAEEPAAEEEATEETSAEVLQVPVTIVNGTDVEIAELYTTSETLEQWGDDILGDQTFAPESAAETAFNVDADNLKWDFKAVDTQGNELEFYGLDLSNCDANGVTVTLTYDHDTQTGQITAQ